jgi:dihydrofolate reductase
MISAIAAVASNGMLGLNGWLPWDIPEELAYFERTVEGAAIVMGRVTYDGNDAADYMPADSFIVTRQTDIVLRPGCTAVPSVEAGIKGALATGKPVFVIGGASVYAAAWPYCNRFYLTRLDMPFAGDTLFPESIRLDHCRIVSDVSKTYRERKTGSAVLCRFLQYEQDNPKPLP